MNQTSQVIATLIHYNVAVRDTLEYCLKKDGYDINLFKDKKRSVLIEVNEHTPLKDIIDRSGENGKKLEASIREFYDEVYGEESSILKLADDGLRVDHAQHLAIYKHVLPIHENVSSMIFGIVNDAHQKNIDISDIEPLVRADERMYRGVATLALTNDLISLFNEFNKAMQDNKGVPSPASNFIQSDLQAIINHLNFIRANCRTIDLDYKEGVEDKVHALIENMTGRRALHPNEKFPDAIRVVQQSVSGFLKPVEDTFRALYVPAMQALISKAREDAAKQSANPQPAAAAPAPESVPFSGEGKDQPIGFGEIDPKTGLPKA
ncbi:MAG: hypothetical protein J5736_00780 [Bacilli bacterium]|nr:hypothetical protein [Bacilli bacterium]